MDKFVLEERLNKLNEELKDATLVAVSKYSPVEDLALAYSLGQLDFGENRVADLATKAGNFQFNQRQNVRWHFIGVLQTKKIKDLMKIPNLHAIHSVSSLKILEEILKREKEFQGSELNLFFQMNTGLEVEKSGFETVSEICDAVEVLFKKKTTDLKFTGLMTMGPIRTENFEEDAKKSFEKLVLARDEIAKKFKIPDLKLSMGMSQDYKIALASGADFIRIGSLIFK